MAELKEELAREIAKRRTFAIISHPDAGKTTLTEKLLLYGGAIHLAGSIKSRKTQRHAVSDWMEIESSAASLLRPPSCSSTMTAIALTSSIPRGIRTLARTPTER